MKNLLLFVLIVTIEMSCTKERDIKIVTYLDGNGLFIVNEGNFMNGNGSLSFYSYDSSKVYNDLFTGINQRPLGDVPNSVEINGERGYIVVNNSGKIEVVNKSDMRSVKTISGLVSPRNVGFINSSRAYVTSMYSDSLAVIDLDQNSVAGYIDVRRSTESIAVTGNSAYVASWVGGHEVMVIDTNTGQVIDSIDVGVEPESMVIDRNNMLWVLCNGGWMRENFAELDMVNTGSNTVEKRFIFPDMQESPTCLKIDGAGQVLYYLDSGVRKMDISASVLPQDAFISGTGHYFYKLAIDPSGGEVFVTDPVDYQQSGYLLRYDPSGNFISDYRTGIIPGSMCFKVPAK